jgi:hypothetical protein
MLIDDRALRAFEVADARIGVHADDQQVALCPGELEILDVAEVDQVEAAVGENDPPARSAVAVKLRDELFERALFAQVFVRLGEQLELDLVRRDRD